MATLDEKIQDNPMIAVAIAVVVIFGVLLLGYAVYKQFSPTQTPPEIMSVEFGDGQNQVIVERNGMVTIKTPFGTYTQRWDPDKIKKFFENLDNLDFESLSEYVGSDLAIALTLNSGEKVTVRISEDMEDLLDIIQNLLENVYEEADSIDDEETYYTGPINTTDENDETEQDSDNSDDDTQAGGSGGGSNNNNDPWNQGGDVVDQEIFGCEAVDSKTGRKVVISNTMCQQ